MDENAVADSGSFHTCGAHVCRTAMRWLLVGTKSILMLSLRVSSNVAGVPIQLLVPCWKPGMGSGYEFSSARPLGLMRSRGMMLPGEAAALIGGGARQSGERVANQAHGPVVRVRRIQQLAEVAVAHGGRRHDRQLVLHRADAIPFLAPEEEQLGLVGVEPAGDVDGAAEREAVLVEVGRRLHDAGPVVRPGIGVERVVLPGPEPVAAELLACRSW